MHDAFSISTLPDDSDPRKVIVKKLALVAADRDPMELDLTGDLTKLKKNVSEFRIDRPAPGSCCFILMIFLGFAGVCN